MPQDFFTVVEKHAQERPQDIAYKFMGQETTWQKYRDEAYCMANSFLKLGLKSGDKIAVALPQSPAFMNVFVAAAAIGLVIVPLDLRLTAIEMASLYERTESKLLIAVAISEAIRGVIETLVNKVQPQHMFTYLGTLSSPDARSYDELLQGTPTPIPESLRPTLDDPLIIIFTSGTTGRPKGAVITHRNTFAIARNSAEIWGVTVADKALSYLPISHVGGTHDQIAIILYAGCTGILMPSFSPKEMLEKMAEEKVTFSGGVPTIYRLIFLHCNVKDYDLSSVRLLVISGEPSPTELIDEIHEKFPNAILSSSFGMSETAGFFTFTRVTDPHEIIAKTEGAPADGSFMRAIRPDGTWADPGEIGELVLKGDAVIPTYMNPEDNIGVFLEDGWMRTGDLGYMDENNYLHYVGRVKEMYISGGYNVYPLEIESYLNAYPGVNTSAVIGVEDKLWGETGYAFVIPEVGAEITVQEIADYCKEGLADYKRPRKIFVVKDVPRSNIGKVAKGELARNMEAYMK